MVYILGEAVTLRKLKIGSVGGLRVRLLLNKNVMPTYATVRVHLLKKQNAMKRQKKMVEVEH
jgi:hypothetical protein